MKVYKLHLIIAVLMFVAPFSAHAQMDGSPAPAQAYSNPNVQKCQTQASDVKALLCSNNIVKNSYADSAYQKVNSDFANGSMDLGGFVGALRDGQVGVSDAVNGKLVDPDSETKININSAQVASAKAQVDRAAANLCQQSASACFKTCSSAYNIASSAASQSPPNDQASKDMNKALQGKIDCSKLGKSMPAQFNNQADALDGQSSIFGQVANSTSSWVGNHPYITAAGAAAVTGLVVAAASGDFSGGSSNSNNSSTAATTTTTATTTTPGTTTPFQTVASTQVLTPSPSASSTTSSTNSVALRTSATTTNAAQGSIDAKTFVRALQITGMTNPNQITQLRQALKPYDQTVNQELPLHNVSTADNGSYVGALAMAIQNGQISPDEVNALIQSHAPGFSAPLTNTYQQALHVSSISAQPQRGLASTSTQLQ